MNIKEIYKDLKIDEGVKYEIYKDHLGYLTFGVGHLIIDSDPEYGKPEGTPVSEERVYEAFNEDVTEAIDECKLLYPDFHIWPEEVQQILVNIMFNMGRTRLSLFKNFKAALEKQDWVEAAKEGRDSKWYRQVTNRAERLMTRLEMV